MKIIRPPVPDEEPVQVNHRYSISTQISVCKGIALRFPSHLYFCADLTNSGNVALSVFQEPNKSISTTVLNALCES